MTADRRIHDRRSSDRATITSAAEQVLALLQVHPKLRDAFATLTGPETLFLLEEARRILRNSNAASPDGMRLARLEASFDELAAAVKDWDADRLDDVQFIGIAREVVKRGPGNVGASGWTAPTRKVNGG